MPEPVALPRFAEDLRDRYLAGEASMFLLYGNIRDVVPWQEGKEPVRWVTMRNFLERFLGRTRDIVAYYNVSQGICFPNQSNEQRFQRTIDTRRAMDGEERLTELPRNPNSALSLIEELVTNPAQTSGVILDYVETVAPNGDLSFMGSDEKANLVALQRWAWDPAFLSTNNLVVLLTEHLSDVSRRLIASPQLATVNIPFPDVALRLRFLQSQDLANVKLEMPLEVLAKVTAGLSLIQIRSLLRGAKQTGQPVTFRVVSERKKTIIEQECHGLVELVEPEHDFRHVGGMERVKRDLIRVSDAVKAGQTRLVPMGMIFVGPMGTGKTFVAEAFAAESGLTCLKFKNFREKWVGSTESNLEKVLDLVEALGFVLLIVDEADRSLSGGDNDGGTGSRVIARLKEFMSDTSHRGRVVVLMMTNRPDKLDTDLKRPGRFDLKIPFFFPEEPEERQRVLEAVVRKLRLDVEPGLTWDAAVATTAGYSAAELELVVIQAAQHAAERESPVLTQHDVDTAVKDVIPSRDTRMLEYMEMLAVFECSARRMLPERFRELDTGDVQQRLGELRLLLGPRA